MTTSQYTPVTSSVVRTRVLDPAMDAVAVNSGVAVTLQRMAGELARAHQTIDRLADLVVQIAAANSIELSCQRTIAGWADELTTSLRHTELNQPGTVLSGRALAAQLAPLLDQLADPLTLERHPPALAELHRLFAATPHTAMFRQAVVYHLGVRRRDQLAQLHHTWRGRRTGR